jgi:SPP1 family predicted phage head-tail adaptor
MPAGATISAGTLRNRIVLQSPMISRGVDASEFKQWNDDATVWAMIDTQGGRQFNQARMVNAELTHEITIRWRSGVSPLMRIRYDDPKSSARYFDIRSVVNPENEKRHMLLLHCVELIGRQPQS